RWPLDRRPGLALCVRWDHVVARSRQPPGRQRLPAHGPFRGAAHDLPPPTPPACGSPGRGEAEGVLGARPHKQRMIDAAMVLVAVVLVLEALVLRHRLQGLRTLTTSESSTPDGPWVFVCADGVTLDAATRQAAVDYAAREGLHVLDL